MSDTSAPPLLDILPPVCLQGLPDPHTVSSSIQQMWALTEVMQTNQTTASIGRFDVSLTHAGWHSPFSSEDSEAAVWSSGQVLRTSDGVLTRREETLPVPLVSMTTVSWQLLLCDPLWSSEVHFLFVFYLTSGLQRRRMCVMTSWGQDGDVTRAFLKSRESFNSKRSERPFKEDGSLGGSAFTMTNVTRQNKTRTERQTHLLQWKESIICF